MPKNKNDHKNGFDEKRTMLYLLAARRLIYIINQCFYFSNFKVYRLALLLEIHTFLFQNNGVK